MEYEVRYYFSTEKLNDIISKLKNIKELEMNERSYEKTTQFDHSNKENSFYSKPFYITKRIGDVIKYRIVNTSYRQKAETLIYKSQIIKELNNLNVNKIEKYKTSDRDKLKNITKALTLLSMFDIIQYDMYGGQNPEIFIRINDPARIKAIAEKSIVYKNNIVKKAIEKHDRDIEILEKFIMELNTDEERWNYIEDYFLGKDVLKK